MQDKTEWFAKCGRGVFCHYLGAAPSSDGGELNYPEILRRIDGLGYAGCFGLEYWPALDPDESLRRMRVLTNV